MAERPCYENGNETCQENRKALDEIVSATEKAMDMIQRIAVATEQLSATSEEIAQNMETIKEKINYTAKMIESVRDITTKLSAETKSLDESVEYFKV